MSAYRTALWGASIAILVGAWHGGAAVAQPAGQIGASSGQGLEEIVVTAQRREERSQSVPISITAFTSERLQQQNITTAQDLNGLVPSLLVSPIGQATRDVEAYTMRGVGPTYQGASAVVVYLAEVPLPAAYTTNQQGGPGNYVDLDNLEVLAGPQGTLFGRNTTGGAVLLVPHKPTNDFGGYVQVSGGNYSYNAVEGAVNIPIVSDKLLVRASGTYQDRDGFTRDIVWNTDRDNMHYMAGRLGVTFRPTENIENYLLAYASYSDDNGPGWVNEAVNIPMLLASGQCTGSCAPYQHYADLAKQLGARTTEMDVGEFSTTRNWGLINKTTFDLNDELTLNNIVSYQSYWKNYAYDGDGLPLQMGDVGSRFPTFPVPLLSQFGVAPNGFSNSAAFGPRDDLRQITEEIQLQGKLFDDHLTYSTGFFYYDLSPNGDQLSRNVFGFCPAAQTGTCTPNFQTYSVSNESEAVYAQGTLDLGIFSPSLENLRLTGGFRYTWDTIDGSTNFYLPLGGGLSYCINTAKVTSNPSACAFGATLHSSAPTWTVGLDYKPIDGVLLYAKISRGYKSGGFNTFAVRVPTRVYDPEYVTSYEAGLKSDWHIGEMPVRLNLDGYRSDYSNIQIFTGDFNNGAFGAQVVNQAAEIQGFEAEANIRPIEAIELGGNVSYTDAHYTTGCVARCGDFPAPEWIYSLHGTFYLPVPEEWGKISLYAGYSFVGRYIQQPNEPFGMINSHGQLNLSAKWQDIAQSNVDLELFATNVTDQLYRITNSGTFSAGFDAALYGEPQMYGVRVRYRFGSEATDHPASTQVYAPPPVQAVAPAPSTPKTYMVFFDFNKSDLTPQAVQIVGTAAKNALEAKVTEITVTGHTDTVGSDAYNMRLSRRRAESVAAELEKDGVPSGEIAIVAKGKRDLLVPTGDGVKEPQNRRVQIVYDNAASS